MEKKKQKKEKAPSLGGNPFDNTDTQHATIGCGLYQEKLPVAGKTIGEIRAEFADRLEIADNAVATVAGVEQGNDYRVGANELILFIQQAGEKGVKKRKLWMVKEDEESDEYLAFYNLDFVHSKRPAKPEEEAAQEMALMLDRSAEDCNAHDFVGAHSRLATIMEQECGVLAANRVLRKLVDYEGLYGLVGVCGKGDEDAVEKDLGVLEI